MSRRERVRIGGEGGTGGWKRKVAITIAKEIKDASVKEKMPGLKKKKNRMFLRQCTICKKQKITISTHKLQLEYLPIQVHRFDYLKHSPQIFKCRPIQKLDTQTYTYTPT